MRYPVGLVCVLAGLVALPLSASAQDGEEGATPEPSLHEPAASTEPAPEEPALRLELNDDSVKLAPSPPPTVDGYTLEEMQVRVKRARIGLGVSALSTVVGIALSAAAGAQRLFCFEPCSYPGWVDPVFAIGLTLAAGGAAGMIASGILFGKRKRKLRRLQHAHYGTPRRVHWDLARSRLVF